MSARILEGRKCRHLIEEKSLGQFFFNRAEKYSDRISQIDGTIDKSETYSSAKLRSTRVAIALQKQGVTSSDVITICSSNTLDAVVPILAAPYLGAKITNLEPSLSVRHTQHLLGLVTPKVIFVEESALNLVEESLVGTNFQTIIVVFGSSGKYQSFVDLTQEQENEDKFRPVDVDPDDVAVMFFSSGTTGLPKAICHTHRTLFLIAAQLIQIGFYGTSFHFTSFYWMTALGVLLSCYQTGNSRVFCRKPTAEDIFKIIQKYKVSFMFMAPILTYQLTSFEKAHDYDTSSLKMIICGGTPMAASQIQNMHNVFKHTFTVLACGMSEIGVVACFDPELDRELAAKRPTSCGKPGPGLRIKIVDPDSRKLLGPNQKGEICIACPFVMKGYYRGDSSQVFDDEGFLKTGDVGYYDEDDCLYVIERIKEMFKYKSWHIIPSSIEAVLLEHPSIREAVVFGIPHEEDGDVPAACIVLKEGSTLSEAAVDDFLKSRVSDRERLRGGVFFRDSLPKTPTGKMVRKEVKNLVISSLSK